MGRERIWRFGSFGFVIGRSAMGFQNYFGVLGSVGTGKPNHGSVQARIKDQRVVAVVFRLIYFGEV